jgi:hypothetical protein
MPLPNKTQLANHKPMLTDIRLDVAQDSLQQAIHMPVMKKT